jgi:hypothetical protein
MPQVERVRSKALRAGDSPAFFFAEKKELA